MRSDTPAAVDILDALLSPADPTPPAAAGPEAAFLNLPSLDRLIRQAAAPPDRKKTVQAPPGPKAPAALRDVAPRKTPKRKVTHYVEEATRDRLDRARDALAALAAGPADPDAGRPKVRITKSGLVEAALSLALDGFEASGPDSPLARHLRTTRGFAPAPSSSK